MRIVCHINHISTTNCEISYHRNTVGIEYYGNIMEDIEPTI